MTSFRSTLEFRSARRKRLRAAGFSLLETVVATGLCALAISAFYLAIGQAIRIARAGRETAMAGEVIQQRVSSFRRLAPWTTLTTTAGATQLMAATNPCAANFNLTTETLTVAPYPATGSTFSVSRASSGLVTIAGASLPATQRCVQVTVQVAWTGAGNLPVTRTVSTILSKGGI